MKISAPGFLLFLWVFILTGCGGPGSSDNFASPSVGLNTKVLVGSTETTEIPDDEAATVYLLLIDNEGFPLSNVSLDLSATLGNLSSSNVSTDSNGEASVTLSAPSTLTATSSGTLTVLASSGENTSINYSFIVDDVATGTGEEDSAGINLTLTVASSGEETYSSTEDFKVAIKLLDSEGDPVPQAIINVSATSGSLIQSSLLTDDNGEASIDINAPDELIAGTAPGTFTASSETGYSAKINYQFVATSSVGTGEEVPAASIQFIGAEPSMISLKGTGGFGYGETSKVIFKVVDDEGKPVQGAEIQFGLTTEVGGLALSDTEVVSNASGEVFTTVQAGTIATPVRVTATLELESGESVFVQSDLLTVTTGIPDQNSVSLSLETFAPESWRVDGVTVPVTIRLADRNNNPVPDGTVINFTTEGGRIDGYCETLDSTCSVTWTSQNPRPADHRATILAYAIGHETYFDLNADGIFNDGDSFDDLKEAYRDDDESGHFDPVATTSLGNDFAVDERFIDYNSDQVFDHEDTKYNGVPCNHSTDCVEEPQTTLTNVRAQGLIIMADEYANAYMYHSTDGTRCLDTSGHFKTDGTCTSSVVFGTGTQAAVLWIMAEDTAAFCHDGAGFGTEEDPYVRVDSVNPNDEACTVAIRQTPATGTSIGVNSDVGELSEVPVTEVLNQYGHVEFFVTLTSADDNEEDKYGAVELVVTTPAGHKSVMAVSVYDPAF